MKMFFSGNMHIKRTSLLSLFAAGIIVSKVLLAGEQFAHKEIDPDLVVYHSHSLEKICSEERPPKEAYALLKEQEKQIPQEYWTEKEQSYLREVTQKLNEYYGGLLTQAEELFAATLYADAIPIYQDIWSAIEQNTLPESAESKEEIAVQVVCRLGQAHYYSGNYLQATKYLKLKPARIERLPSHLQDLQRQGIYVLALSYRHLGEYNEAISTLQNYENSGSKTDLGLYDEVQFELGLNLFLAGKLQQARQHLEYLNDKSHKPQIYYLSRLYLARTSLAEGNYSCAQRTLDALSYLIPEGDVLRFELDYLRGEACFQINDFSQAAKMFESSLPKRNHEHAPWYQETLYHLGWSYLKLGDDNAKAASLQKEYFDKAEDNFKKLLEISSEERVFLALAQCYLTRANRLKDEESYQSADALLAREELFPSHEAKTHALLLRADAASTYEARDIFYKELTRESNSKSPFYAKGWYLRGINDFEEAQRCEGQAPEKARKIFKSSAAALSKAFDLLKSHEKERAALAIKYQILANYRSNTVQGWLNALSTLENCIDNHRDILIALGNPEEMNYLQILTAARLDKEARNNPLKEEGPARGEYAERCMRRYLDEFPRGGFKAEVLNLLGAYYFDKERYADAEEVFQQLAADCPASPLAGGALYWSANCAEKLKGDPKAVREYRRKLYEGYPQSPLAPAAYFQYYSYHEYLQGDRTAVKHLQAFAAKFPDTPLLINSYYLIGLDYKRDRKTPEGKWIRKRNLMEAIDAFLESETHFDHLCAKGGIPEEQLAYYSMIRYRAILERALANLAIAEESQGAKREIYLQYAEDVFKQINRDLSGQGHSIAQHPAEGHAFPPIQEESAYWLAITYVKGKNDQAAQEVISQMLDKYRSLNMKHGYYLSRILYEQGMLGMRHDDYESAWESFMRAEEAGKGKYLSVDQKLDLWIQQSLCYRAMNQMDKAMLILSKVINDDAVSSLRLKAMYLRAEIYELQGRHELARKQLEATSKKGGEWAQKAKMKLDKDYGYQ